MLPPASCEVIGPSRILLVVWTSVCPPHPSFSYLAGSVPRRAASVQFVGPLAAVIGIPAPFLSTQTAPGFRPADIILIMVQISISIQVVSFGDTGKLVIQSERGWSASGVRAARVI